MMDDKGDGSQSAGSGRSQNRHSITRTALGTNAWTISPGATAHALALMVRRVNYRKRIKTEAARGQLAELRARKSGRWRDPAGSG